MKAFFAMSALVLVLLPAAHADSGPPPLLCGIDPTLDAVLRCPPPPPAGTPAPPPGSGSTLRPAHAVARGARHVTYLPDTLLVGMRGNPAGLFARLHLQVVRRVPALRLVIVRGKPSQLAALRRSPHVAFAGRDAELHVTAGIRPNDTFFDRQWGLQLAHVSDAWAETTGSAKVLVAVVDTGVDATHPDLAGLVDQGVDLVGGGAGTHDDNGHGTAVAGVIAARPNNSQGGAGVCWRCEILPIKAIDASGLADVGTIAAGIVRAADLGARVINVSAGGPGDPDGVLHDAVDYATAKGALVVAAAGNVGLDVPYYPAYYASTLSVAGVDTHDQLYSWSERGAWVDVAAPGCDVAPVPGGQYEEFCGTSAATPVVSGLAALALSFDPSATAPHVVQAIESTAARTGIAVGYGRIDAAQALRALGVKAPQSVTATLRGASTVYTRAVGAGIVSLTLSASGRNRFAVRVLDAAGRQLGTRAGASPLRFSVRTVDVGTIRVVVRRTAGSARRSTLQLRYPAS